MSFSKLTLAFVGATLLAGHVADAHSWLECSDWRAASGEWRPTEGNCAARPRYFGGGGGYNSQLQSGWGGDVGRDTFNLQYLSIPNPDTSDAYSANAPYGTVTPGDTVCWSWPAKNHAEPNVGLCGTANGCPVKVYWPETPGVQPSTAVEWEAHPVVAQQGFGDSCSNYIDNDKKACGMCFQVPARANGFYSVQWWWEFNQGQFYRDGLDYLVTDSSAQAPPPTPRPTPGPTPPPSNNPSPTPPPVSGGGTPGSTFTVYRDSLSAGFRDSSWAQNYDLSSTAQAYEGSRSIEFTPNNWQAVYFQCSNDECISTSEWYGVSFWVNGGSSSGQLVAFEVIASGTETGSELSLSPYLSQNQWVNVQVAFSDLGIACGAVLSGMWWQTKSANAQATIYLDDVELVYGLSDGRSVNNPLGLTADSPELVPTTIASNTNGGRPPRPSGDGDGLSPSIAGAIGGVVGLVAGAAIAAAMLMAGVLRRKTGNDAAKQSSYQEFQVQ